jgi:hypothetical protein
MVHPGFRHAANQASPALIALMLASAPAFSSEPNDSAAAATPRQVAHCMMKRLRADRSESYRDAFRTCKQELAAPNSDLATAMNSSSDAAAMKQR